MKNKMGKEEKEEDGKNRKGEQEGKMKKGK